MKLHLFVAALAALTRAAPAPGPLVANGDQDLTPVPIEDSAGVKVYEGLWSDTRDATARANANVEAAGARVRSPDSTAVVHDDLDRGFYIGQPIESVPHEHNPAAHNAAMGVLSRDAHSDDMPYVHMEIGNQKAHVGTISPRELFDFISDSTRKACPEEAVGSCNQATKYEHGPIVYNAPKGGGLAKNSHVWFQVKDSFIPNVYGGRRLPSAMAAHIATLFALAISDDKNCYTQTMMDWQKGHRRSFRMCNVPTWAKLSIQGLPPDISPYLEVNFDWNSKTHDGHFDCVAIMAEVTKSINGAHLYDIEAAINNKFMWGEAICPNIAVSSASGANVNDTTPVGLGDTADASANTPPDGKNTSPASPSISENALGAQSGRTTIEEGVGNVETHVGA